MIKLRMCNMQAAIFTSEGPKYLTLYQSNWSFYYRNDNILYYSNYTFINNSPVLLPNHNKSIQFPLTGIKLTAIIKLF